jgi:3',5'-cyclic AMP phosphodiesterase CpdA
MGRAVRVALATLLVGEMAACARSPSVKFAGAVRFAAIGDFGTGGDNQRKVADAMCALNAERPFDFIVSTGDNVYGKGSPEDFEGHFERPYECLTSKGVRFHAVLGNHDVLTENGRPEIDDPVFGMPSRYYTWRSGPVAFVMLDSNTIEDSDVQHAWALERARAARSSPWTVVVLHHPIFSGSKAHGSTPGFDELLGDPFAGLGVDLVLAGHDHDYGVARDRGITHILNGGGGANLYNCEERLPPKVESCIKRHHFLEITATTSALTVRAIDPQGSVFDEVEVERNE